ncbi:hypothetical protein [Shewanella sp.]|uniref:hypothetical protein n=1 Tax=Shewanella sp. TaxID=50422 RepID=UPI0040472528
MTAKEIYIKYFLTDLKRKVFDEVYEEIETNQNQSSIDIDLLVHKKITDVNTKPVISSFTFTCNGTVVATPFITASMVNQSTNNITSDISDDIKKYIYSDSQAGQELCRIVSDQVDRYIKQQLNNDIPNTIETLMCLIEVEEMCINASRCSIKDIINTRYSELDETDQFTITLATGYKNEHNDSR